MQAGKSLAFPERIKQFSENGKFDLRRGGNYENQPPKFLVIVQGFEHRFARHEALFDQRITSLHALTAQLKN